MILLDGRALATRIKKEVAEDIKKLGISPGLAIVLVGNDPASHLYVRLKEKACEEVGIRFEKYVFKETVSNNELLSTIRQLNDRSDVDAILVQLPLPAPHHEEAIIRAINPEKDVDGFHPTNLDALIEGRASIIPGVALGIVELIKIAHTSLQGKTATLVVNSTVFAAPIEYLLESLGVLVHIVLAPSDLRTTRSALEHADIIVIAIGRPQTLTPDLIKADATIVDVGTNRTTTGTVVGDVDFDRVKEKAGALTPVPGGVGPMTVAMLLQNVLKIAKERHTKQ